MSDRSAPVYQIPARECLCDGCQTNERWDGKPDQTPLTRHDMNFWLFSGEPTTTWKTFLFVSSHHFETKEFSCAEVALRVGKSWLRRRTRASHRWLRCLWRRPMSSLCFCSVPQLTAYLLNSQTARHLHSFCLNNTCTRPSNSLLHTAGNSLIYLQIYSNSPHY